MNLTNFIQLGFKSITESIPNSNTVVNVQTIMNDPTDWNSYLYLPTLNIQTLSLKQRRSPTNTITTQDYPINYTTPTTLTPYMDSFVRTAKGKDRSLSAKNNGGVYPDQVFNLGAQLCSRPFIAYDGVAKTIKILPTASGTGTSFSSFQIFHTISIEYTVNGGSVQTGSTTTIPLKEGDVCNLTVKYFNPVTNSQEILYTGTITIPRITVMVPLSFVSGTPEVVRVYINNDNYSACTLRLTNVVTGAVKTYANTQFPSTTTNTFMDFDISTNLPSSGAYTATMTTNLYGNDVTTTPITYTWTPLKPSKPSLADIYNMSGFASTGSGGTKNLTLTRNLTPTNTSPELVGFYTVIGGAADWPSIAPSDVITSRDAGTSTVTFETTTSNSWVEYVSDSVGNIFFVF